MKTRNSLFAVLAAFGFITVSLAQVDPCLKCNINCYKPYFKNLNITDSCKFANNVQQFKENLSTMLYNTRSPLWAIGQTGQWVIYYNIESWDGPVTDVAINNLTKKYESMANQWLAGLSDFDPDAPKKVTVKVFGFAFSPGIQIDPSFYRTYGNYPLVTNWPETNESSPWRVVHRNDLSEFNQNWYEIDDFNTLKVVGNNTSAYPNANFSPTNWGSYKHPEGVDMFYTKFWQKTTWDAVGQRQYLKIGGCITNHATGEVLDGVITHEMGHCLFHDDFHDSKKYPCAKDLTSVMNDMKFENGTWITAFDKVIMRIIWEAQKYRKNLAVDNDGDSFCANSDCDDNNPAIYPDAKEIPKKGID